MFLFKLGKCSALLAYFKNILCIFKKNVVILHAQKDVKRLIKNESIS